MLAGFCSRLGFISKFEHAQTFVYSEMFLGLPGKETLVVYHLQQLSGNSGWKVNGTRLFGSFQWKISGSNGTSEKVVLFFRTECSKRKFVYHLFKPNL